MGILKICLLPTGCTPTFPSELQKYGLTESILTKALLQCSQAKQLPVDVDWCLKETLSVGFYRELHTFLRKWPISRAMTKVALGRFYISIDSQLYCKGTCGRPDNVYQCIIRQSFLCTYAQCNSKALTQGEMCVCKRSRRAVV